MNGKYQFFKYIVGEAVVNEGLLCFNPSAWSDERCSRSEITTCRGVTGTARRAALKI
jgi:hypothetical protein